MPYVFSRNLIYTIRYNCMFFFILRGTLPSSKRRSIFLGALTILTPFATLYCVTWVLVAAVLYMFKTDCAFNTAHSYVLKCARAVGSLVGFLCFCIGRGLEFVFHLINLTYLLPNVEVRLIVVLPDEHEWLVVC